MRKSEILLVDERELKRFSSIVLPTLRDDEVLIAILAARRKYGGISRSEEILDKLILKQSDSDYVVRKIRKFSYVENCYIDYKTGNTLTNNCMVMYIDILPRSAVKAFKVFSSDIHNWMYQAIASKNFSYELFRKLDTKLFSALARSLSSKPYFIVDIDTKDEDLLNKVTEMLDGHVVWITETRGGYHVIVHRNEYTGKIIHINVAKLESVEVFSKQGLTPVPGTLQGGFFVKEVVL